MKKICRIIYLIWDNIQKIINHFLLSPFKKALCGACGKNVLICRKCRFIWKNVYIGNDVSINEEALFLCSRAKIKIGDHVIFGPRVTLITGNHRTNIVGKYMSMISDKEKSPEDDEDIVFQGDNWVGANVTILKGVTIGVGAIIGAGALVIDDVPDYAVVGGIPAQVIKYRFTETELKEHKKLLKP